MNMSKKYKQVFLYLLYIVFVIVFVLLSPRFGYRIVDEQSSPQVYKFDKLGKRDVTMKEAIYISEDGSILTLLYESRFSQDVVIEKNNKFEYFYTIRLDGAITNSDGTDANISFVLFNIISADSGAFYFLAFLKPLFFAIISIFLFETANRWLKPRIVTLQTNIAALSFVISVLFALRII